MLTIFAQLWSLGFWLCTVTVSLYLHGGSVLLLPRLKYACHKHHDRLQNPTATTGYARLPWQMRMEVCLTVAVFVFSLWAHDVWALCATLFLSFRGTMIGAAKMGRPITQTSEPVGKTHGWTSNTTAQQLLTLSGELLLVGGITCVRQATEALRFAFVAAYMCINGAALFRRWQDIDRVDGKAARLTNSAPR
jgi:hypothetical protein